MAIKMSVSQYNKLTGEKAEKTKQKRKVNKYHNRRINRDGISFDSIAEYERYQYLILLERTGEIFDLRYHQKEDNIILQENPKIVYEPDFVYKDKNGQLIVEDLKGAQTKEFILKKKMIISMINNGLLSCMFIITKKKSTKCFETVELYESEKK